MNEMKVSQKSNRERERESRSESFFVRIEAGWQWRRKEKEIFDPRKVFSFSREIRVETRESGKGNPRKYCGFHFNGILVILIIE